MDIRNPLAEATGLEVELENAANALRPGGLLVRHMRRRNLVVADGFRRHRHRGSGERALVRGLGGMAGEFGHVPVDPSGPLCGCGSRGCWEVFASNRAALRYYPESGAESRLDFSELSARADAGDARAAAALETMARIISAAACGWSVAGLAPERIVVVGDLTKSWHCFGPIDEAEVRRAGRLAPPPRVAPSRQRRRHGCACAAPCTVKALQRGLTPRAKTVGGPSEESR